MRFCTVTVGTPLSMQVSGLFFSPVVRQSFPSGAIVFPSSAIVNWRTKEEISSVVR